MLASSLGTLYPEKYKQTDATVQENQNSKTILVKRRNQKNWSFTENCVRLVLDCISNKYITQLITELTVNS